MLFAYYSNINIIILIYVVVRSKEIYFKIYSHHVLVAAALFRRLRSFLM